MHTSCVFVDQRVELGAAQYENCIFRQCLMVVDGRPVHLAGCRFEGCSWTFEGPAGNGVAMLRYVCQNDPAVAANVATEFGFFIPSSNTHH